MMVKWLAVLTVVLTSVALASGQTVPSHKHRPEHNNPPPIQAAPTPTGSESAKQSNTTDQEGGQKAVSIDKFPVISVGRDWIDKTTLVFSCVAILLTATLVRIGFLGVRSANRTLKAIELQVVEMRAQAKATEYAATAAKESAQATLKQANIAINADRAWVFVSVAQWEFIQEDQGDEILHHARVTIELENFGGTPAFLTSARCGASFAKSFGEIDESIFSSVNEAYQIGDVERLPLPPGKQVKVIEATSPDSLDEAEWSKFMAVGGSWYRSPVVYGIICYRDAYDNERMTKFCLARWKEGSRIVGTSGVNSYT